MFCDKIYVLGNASGFAQIPRNLLRFIHKSLQKKLYKSWQKKLRKKYTNYAQKIWSFRGNPSFWV